MSSRQECGDSGAGPRLLAASLALCLGVVFSAPAFAEPVTPRTIIEVPGYPWSAVGTVNFEGDLALLHRQRNCSGQGRHRRPLPVE